MRDQRWKKWNNLTKQNSRFAVSGRAPVFKTKHAMFLYWRANHPKRMPGSVELKIIQNLYSCVCLTKPRQLALIFYTRRATQKAITHKFLIMCRSPSVAHARMAISVHTPLAGLRPQNFGCYQTKTCALAEIWAFVKRQTNPQNYCISGGKLMEL